MNPSASTNNPTTTFKINKGTISFEERKVVIDDNEKLMTWASRLSAVCWITSGIFSILRFQKNGETFLLWYGLSIGMVALVFLFFTLLRSTKSEILTSKVETIQLKERFGNKSLDIKLRGFQTRRVSQIEKDYQRLAEYLHTHHSRQQTPQPM